MNSTSLSEDLNRSMFDLNNLLKDNNYLRAKVIPNSNENKLVAIMDDQTVKIRIAAKPEKGKANKELIKFLAQTLNTSKEKIEIISGHTDPLKLIRIDVD